MRVPGAHTRPAALPAALLALACFALYLSQRHDGLFENGPELMEMWRKGIVVHTHALILPLARLAADLGLAGWPAVPDRAVSLVSALGAALAVGVVAARAARWTGTREALLAGAILGLAPALRFYAGAVETRALGCGCAALAGALAGHAARTRGRALLGLALGYALACAAHVSLVVLAPALLLLHADAELRAGRPVTFARLAVAGAALTGTALATAALVYAAGQLLNPDLPSAPSWPVYYLQVSMAWAADVGQPHPLTWTLSEILGPFDALLPLALVGVVPLLRRAPWRAVGLLAWTLLLAFASYRVGSRQLGGYFLAALPALGWLAAEGLRHLAHARSTPAALGATALALVALLALPAALDAWAAAGGDAAFGGPPYRIWLVVPADLAMPWPESARGFWTGLHPLVGLALAAVAGLLAGSVGGARPAAATAEAPAAASGAARLAPTLALAALALVLQVAGGERFRERWPFYWGQQIRDYCGAVRAALGPRDHFFTAVNTPIIAWQFNYYLGDRWTDLGQEAYLAAGQREPWMAGIQAELARVRAGGGTAYLGRSGLLLLAERSRESPIALATARRWVNEGRVMLWTPP
jgi:hypothetical protein